METEVKVMYEIWKAERELGYCKGKISTGEIERRTEESGARR